MNASRDKYKRAALILTDFLQDMSHERSNILGMGEQRETNYAKQAARGKKEENPEFLNLDCLDRETPQMGSLEKLDKIELVNSLLSMIQPYLSANNLAIAPVLEVKSTGRAKGSDH